MKTNACLLICVISGASPSSSPSTTKARTSIEKVTLSVPATQGKVRPLVTLKPSIDHCTCVACDHCNDDMISSFNFTDDLIKVEVQLWFY